MARTTRVLHVDDDPSFGDLVATFLERETEDIAVVSATSAEAGLEAFDEERIECVVSDYDMPGQDGLEFLDEIRERDPDVPFILFTGKGNEEIASEAISAGVTDYMQKGGGTDQYTVLANRVQNAVRQHRSQRVAKQMERRLEAVTDSSTDCIWMFSGDWEELLFISGYEAVWGRPVEAIRDDPLDFMDGVHPDDREPVRAAMERLSSGETVDIEYRIRGEDDETDWVWVKGEPVFDDGGSVARVVGFTRDITDRKIRERTLQEEREFIEQALDALDEVFYVVNPDGTLQRWNDTVVTTTGLADEQIAEADAVDLFPADQRDRISDAIDETITTGSATVEADLQTTAGERIPHEFTGARLTDPDGSLVGIVGVGRDISGRRERERELERYGRLVEQLPVGVFRTSVAGDYRSMNDALVDIFGVESREALRDVGVQSLCADDADRQELLDRLHESGTVEDELLRMETVDGEPRWIRTTLTLGEEGGEHHVDGIARDVTDHRELIRRRERAETMFEHAQDALFLVDVGGDGEFRVQRVNRAYEELTGLSTADVQGQTPREILPDDQAAAVEARYGECLDRRAPIEYDEKLAVNGAVRYWHTRLAPVVEDGRVVQLVGATRDVTEQTVKERQLAAILENTTTPMFLKDGDGEYLLVNEAFLDLFGFEAEEAVVGHTDRELFPDRMTAEVVENDEAVLDAGEPIEVEEEIRVRGSERVFLTSKVPVYDIGVEWSDDDPVAVFGVASDITDRKRRERTLEQQNEQFDELASVVSHDLKTPIETVRGRLELAAETGDADHIEEALASLERVDELRGNILDMVRSREVVVDTAAVSVAAVANSAWDAVTADSSASLAVVEDVSVDADAEALNRLLQNLLANSVEHGSEAVTVHVGQTECGFYVADDGPGIPEAHRDAVFTPGFTTKPGGTGMGMASVRQIVNAHGWHITVSDSDELGGVRFEVSTTTTADGG